MCKWVNFVAARKYISNKRALIARLRSIALTGLDERNRFSVLNSNLVSHHFVLTGKRSGHKTVATRFSVLNSNLLINQHLLAKHSNGEAVGGIHIF